MPTSMASHKAESSNTGLDEIDQELRDASNGADAQAVKVHKSSSKKKGKKKPDKSMVNVDNMKRNKNLVEELKLFQNTNLIHQRDPMEQLQQQLSRMIQEDETTNRAAAQQRLLHDVSVNHQAYTNDNQDQQTSLSYASANRQLQSSMPHQENINGSMPSYESGDGNMLTIKKGIVYYQPQSKRLFQRWRKRYIILTPNSIFFFKKSSSKVGRSEMGKFVCKTSLGDITRIEDLKGVIILYTKDNLNFYLRSKEHSEWISLIDVSIERLRRRKLQGSGLAPMNVMMNMSLMANGSHQTTSGEGFYENAAPPTQTGDALVINKRSSSGSNINGASNDRSDGSRPEHREPSAHTNGDLKIEIASESRLPRTVASSGIGSCSIEQMEDGNQQQQQQQQRDAWNNNNNNVSFRGRDAARKSERGTEAQSMINDDVPAKDERKEAETPPERRHLVPKRGSLSEASTGGAPPPPTPGEKRKAQSAGARQSPIQSTQSSLSSSASASKGKASRHLDEEPLRPPTFESDASSNENNNNLVSGSGDRSSKSSSRVVERTSSERRFAAAAAAKQLPDAAQEPSCGAGQLHLNQLHSNGQLADNTNRDRVEGRRDSKQGRAVNTNLIRRDESWQSLVSLTQAGKQVVQGPLYTPAMASDRIGGGVGGHGGQQQRKQSSIDSTATPMRNKPVRQQSLQVYPQRRLALLSRQQQQPQASSFDAAQLPSSPSLQYNANANASGPPQTPSSSYQQKLLQLQLLHNSNNIDYIRNSAQANNAASGGNNDYQIYGPESIATTNHYGYYSMRSNLKSAASEFSFVRPSSSSVHKPNPLSAYAVSALSHKAQLNNNNDRASLVLSSENHASFEYPPLQMTTSSPSANGQYLLQGPAAAVAAAVWQERAPQPAQPQISPAVSAMHTQMNAPIVAGAGQHLQQPTSLLHTALADLSAPNRDLPLKPNKRRQPPSSRAEAQAQKNFPGSGLVHFLKRAFSKRSKRRPRLAESCSSSMMGSNFEGIQVVPQSAYSTGSKEFQGAHGAYQANQQQQQQQQALVPQQQQRMIDLIEAFANKTALDGTQQRPTQLANFAEQQQRQNLVVEQQVSTLQRANFGATRLRASGVGRHPPMITSSLQKSNSISTSSGFGGLNEAAVVRPSDGQQRMFDGGTAGYAVPLITRSTKVMSANLTPVFGRKDALEAHIGQFASPNRHSANLEHVLPRPSSIYGQPSMTSSPGRSHGREFGVHRNSSHGGGGGGYHHARGHSSNVDFRQRNQMMSKAPFLDTTREVAEELASPTAGDAGPIAAFLDYGLHRDQASYQIDATGNLVDGDEHASSPRMPLAMRNFSAHHSNQNQSQNQRQAIVNPILQSPTMSFIYDNHPSVRRGDALDNSHYDNNHPPVDYHPPTNSVSSMELSGGSDNLNGHHHHQAAPSMMMSNHAPGATSNSPFAARRHSRAGRQSYTQNGDQNDADQNAGAYPSPARQTSLHLHQNGFGRDDYTGDASRSSMNIVGKPAAIVTPSTPSAHARKESKYAARRAASSANSSSATPGGRHSDLALAGSRAQMTSGAQLSPVIGSHPGVIAAISPVASRRLINQQPAYPQSPLVNRQARVVQRGHGVQATVMSPALSSTRQQSTLDVDDETHGVDCFEATTSMHAGQETSAGLFYTTEGNDDLNSDDGAAHVPSLISKTSTNDSGPKRTSTRALSSSGNDGASSSRSTISSSTDNASPFNSMATKSTKRSRGSDKSTESCVASNNQIDKQTPIGGHHVIRDRRRDSSSEQSVELSSQTGSIEEPEEKNWVNSKLMQ